MSQTAGGSELKNSLTKLISVKMLDFDKFRPQKTMVKYCLTSVEMMCGTTQNAWKVHFPPGRSAIAVWNTAGAGNDHD